MFSINRISIDDAKLLIEGARNKASQIGIPMCIAIVDESGQLVAFERMDGGKETSSIVAQDKAVTAAGARKLTHEYNAACQPGNLVLEFTLPLAGGFVL